jgi:hypothetical protein
VDHRQDKDLAALLLNQCPHSVWAFQMEPGLVEGDLRLFRCPRNNSSNRGDFKASLIHTTYLGDDMLLDTFPSFPFDVEYLSLSKAEVSGNFFLVHILDTFILYLLLGVKFLPNSTTYGWTKTRSFRT